MTSWQLSTPTSPQQWQDYYQLRYQVLRQPWGQPVGSERDELEDQSYHAMVEQAGQVLAVGRIHRLSDGRAQVRYMAVAPQARGSGFGAVVLAELERQAQRWGCVAIVLNAREQAIGFYRKANYQLGAELEPLYGIPHQQMTKQLCVAGTVTDWANWAQQLQHTWHSTIPLSAFMQLQIAEFNGYQLSCHAPLAPNINLHHTMFAGSIYTLLTLTGWGLVYLQLQSLGLHGHIVLADADIQYLKPVKEGAVASARLADAGGQLAVLAHGRRVRQQVLVELVHGNEVLARFSGRFAVLPERVA